MRKSDRPDGMPQDAWDKSLAGQLEKVRIAFEELGQALWESWPGRILVRFSDWFNRRLGGDR